MSFENVIGHEKQGNVLLKQLDAGRLPHALLFEGPAGVGKTTFARELARIMLCEGDRAAGCDCRNCKRLTSGNQPAFKALRPPEEKQKFPVEMVRDEVVEALGLKSMEKGWRVFVFNNAEKMSDAAANVLLKTLEEPPEESLLILECESADAVIETLVSRCQRIRFTPLEDKRVASYLVESLDADHETASNVASLAGGSIGRAIEYLEGDFLELKNRVIDTVVGAGADDVFDAADDLAGSFDGKNLEEKRKKAYPALDALRLYFRDVMVRRISPEAKVFNRDRKEFSPVGSFPSVDPEKAMEVVDRTTASIRENVNFKLAFSRMMKDYVKVALEPATAE